MKSMLGVFDYVISILATSMRLQAQNVFFLRTPLFNDLMSRCQ